MDTKRTTESRNKLFEELSPAGRRVAIAKEVIEQIRNKRLLAAAGTGYFTGYISEDRPPAPVVYDIPFATDIGAHAPDDVQACDVLEGLTCRVCTKGAIFVAAVDLFDQLSAKDGCLKRDNSGTEMYSRIASDYGAKFFDDPVQWAMIEAAFERSTTHDYSDDDDLPYVSFVGWGPVNATDRMILIMQNVIDNNGDFKPEDVLIPAGV